MGCVRAQAGKVDGMSRAATPSVPIRPPMIEAHNFEQRDAGFGWMINHLPTIIWHRRYYAIAVFAAFVPLALIYALTVAAMPRAGSD